MIVWESNFWVETAVGPGDGTNSKSQEIGFFFILVFLYRLRSAYT
jgi:hypothetical protein